MGRSVFLLAVFLLPGCIGKKAVDIATMPVKAGAKATDWATTSQDEADRSRGREIRKQEKQERKACKKEGRDDC
ncbi:MAG: hypothetical protein AB7U35_01805 [Sphingobium sp.]